MRLRTKREFAKMRSKWYWIWYNRNLEKHGSALGKVGRRPWLDWPGGCFESKWIYEPIEDEL